MIGRSVLGRPKGILVGVALILALALLALGLALLVEWDSPALGRAVLDRAETVLGLELEARSFRLHLLGGLELEGLEVRGSLPAGELAARADALRMAHDPWALLSGTVRITELVLESPHIELGPGAEVPEESGGPGPASVGSDGTAGGSGETPPGETAPTGGETGGEEGGSGLELRVDSARIEGGELILGAGEEGGAPTVLQGLDLELGKVGIPGGAGLAGIAGEGRLRAREVHLGEVIGRNAEGRLEVGSGRLRLLDGSLTLDAGRVSPLAADLDLTADPFTYRVHLQAGPVETGRLLLPEDRGELGPGRLAMEIRGRGTSLGTLAGGGSFELDSGTLPQTPLLTAIDALVGGAGLVGREYLGDRAEFAFEGGALVIRDPLQLVAGSLALELDGRAVPGGDLDLAVVLSLPREGVEVKELPRELLDVLTDRDGRLRLPLRVTGTLEAPRVVPDQRVLGELMRQEVEERLQRKIEEEVGGLLQKLLGGNG